MRLTRSAGRWRAPGSRRRRASARFIKRACLRLAGVSALNRPVAGCHVGRHPPPKHGRAGESNAGHDADGSSPDEADPSGSALLAASGRDPSGAEPPQNSASRNSVTAPRRSRRRSAHTSRRRAESRSRRSRGATSSGHARCSSARCAPSSPRAKGGRREGLAGPAARGVHGLPERRARARARRVHAGTVPPLRRSHRERRVQARRGDVAGRAVADRLRPGARELRGPRRDVRHERRRRQARAAAVQRGGARHLR